MDGIPTSRFFFNEHPTLRERGILLACDGHISNPVFQDSMTLTAQTTTLWRGAREKDMTMLQALVDLCTEEGDIVIDIAVSTGKCFLNSDAMSFDRMFGSDGLTTSGVFQGLLLRRVGALDAMSLGLR